LFSPATVEEAVRRLRELGEEYEVIVYREQDYDQILVKVEALPGYERSIENIKEKLIRELRNTTQLRCEVEFHTYGSLQRYEVKAKRFKDLRN
jgi:phenylacetate-CoA ligase